MKATKQFFPAVLFIMPYKMFLTFESVDEILNVIIQMKASEVLLILEFEDDILKFDRPNERRHTKVFSGLVAFVSQLFPNKMKKIKAFARLANWGLEVKSVMIRYTIPWLCS